MRTADPHVMMKQLFNVSREKPHDESRESTGHRERQDPGEDDVTEEPPVDVLLGSEATHTDDRAHLAVSRRDW